MPATNRLLTPSFVLAILASITLVRIIALFLTPLILGVDEAQYWLWSQTPDFGYFSKPPMVAWLITISTQLFGDSPSAIRLTAPLLHFAIALLLWRLTSTLFSPTAGRIAALLWTTMPAVALGSFVISTDTPMLFFLSGFLLLLAPLALRQPVPNHHYALAGVALALALLSKYAGSYGLVGLALWWLASRFTTTTHNTHTSMRLHHWLILLATCLMVISPNLWWNIDNAFVTTRHLATNANWQALDLSLTSGIGFLASQAGVMGPIAIVTLMLALVRQHNQHSQHSHRPWFFAFILPPLVIITIQAIISDANANWAVAAYPMAVVLVSGWLATPAKQTLKQNYAYRKYWLWGILTSNGIIASIVLAATISGSLGSLTPPSDPLRHLRGWETHHSTLADFLTRHAAHTIITDRRQTAALLTYYFRHDHSHDHSHGNSKVQVTINDSDNTPSNYYEANHAWQQHEATISTPQNIVMVTEATTPPNLVNITWVNITGESIVAIGRPNHTGSHTRHLYFFLGRFKP